MPSHVIILNPTSGRGRGTSSRQRLEVLLAAHETKVDWQIRETRSAGDAEVLAQEAAAEGIQVVAAAGGDGTLSEVLNGLMANEIRPSLAVIPLGTGNDFSRHVGIKTDLQAAVDAFVSGTPTPIDVGRVTLPNTSRYFLNICGTGFDALCAARVDNGRSHPVLRHVKGMPAYLLAVLSELKTLKSSQLNYNLDGDTITEPAVLCAIANSTSYGGGMLVAPNASVHDGLFDICTIRDAGRLEFLRAFPSVFKGSHITHPKVKMRRAATLTLESTPPLPILVDGDVLGTTPAKFEMLPRAINFNFPKTA